MDINNLQEELKKVSQIIEENNRLKREIKYSVEHKNKLNEQIKTMRDAHNNRESALKNQIDFMKNILQRIFKECETCKGDGGFMIDSCGGEECADCLGTGVKLYNAQLKNSNANPTA